MNQQHFCHPAHDEQQQLLQQQQQYSNTEHQQQGQQHSVMYKIHAGILIRESFGKKKLKHTNKSSGWCSRWVLPGFGNFIKTNLLREKKDVDLLGPAFDFLRFFTSFELRAVDRSVFCHPSPRSAPPALQSLIT